MNSSKAFRAALVAAGIIVAGIVTLIVVFRLPARKDPIMNTFPTSAVYLFVATSSEQAALRKHLATYSAALLPKGISLGHAGDRSYVLLLTGIGPQKAAERASLLNDPKVARQIPRATAAIVLGVCGGLSPSLFENDVVLYSSCHSSDEKASEISCSPELTASIAAALEANGIASKLISGITSPRAAINRQEKSQLAKTGAAVVDMESYAVLDAAVKAGIPAAIVRVVSDSLDRDLPDFNRALRADGSIDPLAVVGLALTSPVSFSKSYVASRKAAKQLSVVSAAVLSIDLRK